MYKLGTNLSRHILEEKQKHPEIPHQPWTILSQIAYSAKILSREIGRAALVGRLGLVGEKNPTGDAQKKLDIFSNETVIDVFNDTGLVAAIASEEEEDIRILSPSTDSRFFLCVDPLDGSSNTDINGAVGTIFGIYERGGAHDEDAEKEFLRRGSEQIAAGYVMYGTSTILVYTFGYGVHGFTLDRDIGNFILSHENIRCPARGRTYSANMARYQEWSPGIRKLIAYLSERDASTNRPYSLRYTGSLVADLHRCLIEGGLFFYLADVGYERGKLRLLYECAPLSFIIEQAGGRASTGTERILDVQVESIHQRTPLVIGSAEDVKLFEMFYTSEDPPL
ncbi:MAG: class 1 fructose-bisphosphatase [Deltaproteobacteria bacterium]|nr:class 1 fructose-bisphosphatase [Deltaproteobacteria bacterium]NIS78052.1 class 1 fructose-bisphosphatase [Deltaproteobacteria bacterium]